MKYLNKEVEFEEALTKEWIITNGIGGYSSSSIVGANTRKYHGLLVASLTPPARRHVILSKVDESIEVDGEKTILYTNVGRNYISEGFKNLQSFQKEYLPFFTYEVKDVKISKIICMEYGKNTVCLLYRIKNGSKKAKLNLAPLLNFRDFHCMSTNARFEARQFLQNNKIKVILDQKLSYPIYFKCSEGQYIEHQNDTFRDMFYIYGILLTIWNYFTPIFYGINILPAGLQKIFKFNPLYQFITFARRILLDGMVPHWTAWLWCGLSAISVFVIGCFVFKSKQDKFIYYV